MTKATTPRVVQGYLAELERALNGVSAEVRGEIVAGVAEQLNGVDAAEAAVRIEALGDPEFIAAEARAEAGAGADGGVGSQLVVMSAGEARWVTVLAALMVAFGGIVVPVAGWLLGLSMVWLSKSWSLLDKLIATLVPLIVVGVVFLGSVMGGGGSSEEFPASETNNPLLPTVYDLSWSSVVLVALVNVVIGVWLLWRAKDTLAAPVSPAVSVSGGSARSSSWYPLVTVLLLICGGYLGWAVGIVMLWGTDVWTRRQKLWGTLAGPLSIVAGLGVALLVRGGNGFAGWHLVILAGLALPFLANLIVGFYLLRRRANAASAGTVAAA